MMFKTWWACLFLCFMQASRCIDAADARLLPAPPSCKTITQSGSCVHIGSKFYAINAKDKLNWFEAQRYCQRLNANIATIENSVEMRLLTDYLGSKGHNVNWQGSNGFWVNGLDLGSQSGTYYSITDGKLLPYTAWSTNQPDNAGGIEHCIHIWYAYGFGMNDLRCDREQFFICEFKERSSDETPDSAVCQL